MAQVYIPAQMRDLTDGTAQVEVEGRNLREILRQLDARFPGLQARIAEGDAIVAGLQVSIDGALTSRGLIASVRPDSEIHFLPAIGGG